MYVCVYVCMYNHIYGRLHTCSPKPFSFSSGRIPKMPFRSSKHKACRKPMSHGGAADPHSICKFFAAPGSHTQEIGTIVEEETARSTVPAECFVGRLESGLDEVHLATQLEEPLEPPRPLVEAANPPPKVCGNGDVNAVIADLMSDPPAEQARRLDSWATAAFQKNEADRVKPADLFEEQLAQALEDGEVDLRSPLGQRFCKQQKKQKDHVIDGKTYAEAGSRQENTSGG